MARNTPLWLALALALAIIGAQIFTTNVSGNGYTSGQCPVGQVERVYPSPAGFAPASLMICEDENWLRWYRDVNNSSLACGDGIYLNPPTSLDSDLNRYPISFVSPAALSFPSYQARIQFYITSKGGLAWLPWPHELRFTLRSYAYDGSLLAEQIVSSNDGSRIDADNFIWYKYENLLIPATAGGYFEFELIEPAYFLGYGRTWITNFMVQDSFAPISLMCFVPDIIPQEQTPTPTVPPAATITPVVSTVTPTETTTATITPTPDNTTTPTLTPAPSTVTTTSTPWPTSDGGTPRPAVTRTPYQSIPLTPQPTYTPHPQSTLTSPNMPNLPPINVDVPQLPTAEFPAPTLATLAPLDLPPIAFTGQLTAPIMISQTLLIETILTPDATRQASQVAASQWMTDTELMTSGWISETGETLGWIRGEGIQGTHPISAALTLATAVAAPVSIARGLELYMPNLWPYIVALLIMLFWVMLTLSAKFALAMFGVIYRIVDIFIRWFLPGFG